MGSQIKKKKQGTPRRFWCFYKILNQRQQPKPLNAKSSAKG